jgi:hypothetical protein
MSLHIHTRIGMFIHTAIKHFQTVEIHMVNRYHMLDASRGACPLNKRRKKYPLMQGILSL